MGQAPTIDRRAVVHQGSRIGEGVFIGPFCVIGPEAAIGDRCRLESHVVVDGKTELGPDNAIAPMASIGGPPQDLKYDGEPTSLTIGRGNKIREFVTINRGTEGGGGKTVIGDENLLMAYSHIAHDCVVGNRTIFANAATLAGHVEVGDEATIGAYSGVHQFCRVARHAFIGGYSVVTRDAMPWVLTVGNRARAGGLNMVGMRRRGLPRETLDALKRSYNLLFLSKKRLEQALQEVEDQFGTDEEVRFLLEFIRSSKRGVCR